MKTFVKDSLMTVVDDDDARIDSYKANGWQETVTADKPKDNTDKRIKNAINAVNASEAEGKKDKGGTKSGIVALDQKINDAVVATAIATVDSEPVDDGLIMPSRTKTEGKSND